MTILIAGIVGVIGLAAGGWLGGYRVNFTPSYPLGLWRIEALHRNVEVGDLIFICPPPTPQFAMARERGYLRSGLCPGWFSPLIKTVVAVSGQIVEIGPRVVIDGAVLAHSDVHSRDAEGRALVPFAGGVVPAGHLFLFSEFAGSYDSRYFGPIPATGVLGLAHPLLVLDP